MRQNLCKLLKTHVDKISDFRLSTMIMKTNELRMFLHDVDENRTSYTFMSKMSVRRYHVHCGDLGADSNHDPERRMTTCWADVGPAMFRLVAAS